MDAKKLRDSIVERILKQNPNYIGPIDFLKQVSKGDIRLALDGTTFKGTIKNSNLLLKSSEIELALVKLSDEFMKNINSNKDTFDAIQSMLDEKLITFFISLDSNQKISQIAMKDIDKTIVDRNNSINVKVEDHKLKLDTTESLIGTYAIGKYIIKAKELSFEMKNLNYKFDYLTQFDNNGVLNIDSFMFQESSESAALKIGNINIENSTQSIENNLLDASTTYSLKDLYFESPTMQKLELESFTFKLDVLGVDKDGIIEIDRIYSKFSPHDSNAQIELLMQTAQKILNSGFKTDIEAELSGLVFQEKTFKTVNLVLNADLNPIPTT